VNTTTAADGEEHAGKIQELVADFIALPMVSRLAALDQLTTLVAVTATPEETARDERAEALRIMRLVVDGSERPPTSKDFDASDVARSKGWSSRRVTRAWGRWRFAAQAYSGRGLRTSATERSALRASRASGPRKEWEYKRGLRLWLETAPETRTGDDYDGFRRRYNAARKPERPLVSYSRLRQVFDCRWEDLIAVAEGRLALANAPRRPTKTPRPRLCGPHDLIGLAEVQRILDLGRTAARNTTYRAQFPRPAYVQPRGPRTRLWRRDEVVAYAAGRATPAQGDLQATYMDAKAVAETLGLACITVTTRSSPRVPEPAVQVAGLQLWLRDDVATTAKRREAKTR
jgi:hypothetical protein